MEGWGTWKVPRLGPLIFFLDENDALLLSATGRREGTMKRFRDIQIKVPLEIYRDTPHMINLDWNEMEKLAPGAGDEQNAKQQEYIRNDGPHNPPVNQAGSDEIVAADSEDEPWPLIDRLNRLARRRMTSIENRPARRREPRQNQGATTTYPDIDSNEPPVGRRKARRRVVLVVSSSSSGAESSSPEQDVTKTSENGASRLQSAPRSSGPSHAAADDGVLDCIIVRVCENPRPRCQEGERGQQYYQSEEGQFEGRLPRGRG